MQTVTIPLIVERLQQLSDERLLVVYDFVSYLADREGEQAGIEAALSTWSSLRNKLGGRNMLPILIRSPLRWLFLGTARMLLIFRQVHR